MSCSVAPSRVRMRFSLSVARCRLLVVGGGNATQFSCNHPPTICYPLNTNLHLPVHDASGKTVRPAVRMVNAATGLHVEFPAVKRTTDAAVFRDAGAHRPAAMRTLPVQREKLPVDV